MSASSGDGTGAIVNTNPLTCPFCRQANINTWDTVLAESRNFFAVPTKGSLVPGWILILPRQHILNLSALDTGPRAELTSLARDCAVVLEKKVGPVSMFEHGPSMEGTSVGCGVDHAHLHLVSLPFSIADAASTFSFRNSWGKVQAADGLPPAKIAGPYYWHREITGDEYFCPAPSGISQYFRQVIAHRLGVHQRFDYSRFPFEENVVVTIDAFDPILARAKVLAA